MQCFADGVGSCYLNECSPVPGPQSAGLDSCHGSSIDEVFVDRRELEICIVPSESFAIETFMVNERSKVCALDQKMMFHQQVNL